MKKMNVREIAKIIIPNREFSTRKEIIEDCLSVSRKLSITWVNSNYDLSIYNNPDYLVECFLCWIMVSSLCMRDFCFYFRDFLKDDPKKYSFFDDYCGIGMTLIHLMEKGVSDKQLSFFNDNEKQVEIFEKLCKLGGFTTPKRVNKPPKNVDYYLSFEVAEHYRNPLKYLEKIIRVEPKYIVISTSFASKNVYVGHFATYLDNEKEYEPREMKKLFTQQLKEHYEKIYTGWDGRPTIWKIKEE